MFNNVSVHLWLYLRLKGSTPWVLTPQKLAQVKDLCDTEDAKPEHEKRASKGNNNPLGLKQTTWQRHVLIFTYFWRVNLKIHYLIRAIKKTKDADGNGYYPQKMREVFDHRAGDEFRRLAYSRWLLRRSRYFPKRVISIDEATFSVDGRMNHQCHRYIWFFRLLVTASKSVFGLRRMGAGSPLVH